MAETATPPQPLYYSYPTAKSQCHHRLSSSYVVTRLNVQPYLDPPTAVAKRDDREVRGAQLAKYPVDAPARKDIAGRAASSKRTTAAEVVAPLYFISPCTAQ